MVDAVEKVTGKAKYSTDIALPNMLCGKVLRSPYSHARIKNIDTSAAEKLPGVAAVVTWSDSSGIPFSSSQYHDQYILAKDKVRFVGDEVAAVAAVDEQTAIEALELIKVDYEILPAVYDIDSALAEDAPIIHEDLDNNVRQIWSMSVVILSLRGSTVLLCRRNRLYFTSAPCIHRTAVSCSRYRYRWTY